MLFVSLQFVSTDNNNKEPDKNDSKASHSQSRINPHPLVETSNKQQEMLLPLPPALSPLSQTPRHDTTTPSSAAVNTPGNQHSHPPPHAANESVIANTKVVVADVSLLLIAKSALSILENEFLLEFGYIL